MRGRRVDRRAAPRPRRPRAARPARRPRRACPRPSPPRTEARSPRRAMAWRTRRTRVERGQVGVGHMAEPASAPARRAGHVRARGPGDQDLEPLRAELRGDGVEQAEVLPRAVGAHAQDVGAVDAETPEQRRRIRGRAEGGVDSRGDHSQPLARHAEALFELGAHVLGGHDHEPGPARDARDQRAVPVAVGAPVPGGVRNGAQSWITTTLRAPESGARLAATGGARRRAPRAGARAAPRPGRRGARAPQAAGRPRSAPAAAGAGASTARAPSARHRRARAGPRRER